MDYLLDNVENDEEKAVLLQNYIQNIGFGDIYIYDNNGIVLFWKVVTFDRK